MLNKKEVLAEWVEEYTEDLYRWALYKTSSTNLAEDLVQDTFLAAAEGWNNYASKSKPKTWLFGILKNKIADYYRERAKQETQTASEDVATFFFDKDGAWKKDRRPIHWTRDQDHLLEEKDMMDVLHKCLKALPEVMRHCLQLTYFHNQKGRDICQDLGISTTNYWQLMSRGRLRLRSCLEKNWFTLNH